MDEHKNQSGAHLGLQAEMEILIRNSHLFKSLDDEGRMRALQESSLRQYDTDTVILTEGEYGEEFFLIASGTVRVATLGSPRRGATTRADGDGTVALATLGRGAFFGEAAVLTGCPRTATVTAAEPVLVVVFESALVDRLLDAYPRVRKLLETLVLGRARDTIEKITR